MQFGEYAEDIGQATVLHYLEGKGDKQFIRHAARDVVRALFGDTRNEKHPAQEAERRAGDSQYVAAPEKSEAKLIAERAMNRLSGQNRVIAYLYFKWGFNQEEIAEVFGFKDPRACQKLREIREELKRITKWI